MAREPSHRGRLPAGTGCFVPQAYRPQTGCDAWRSDLRRLQARGVFRLFWRCPDLSLRSRRALAAGVRRRHALPEGARRDGPCHRPGARGTKPRLEATDLGGRRGRRLRRAGPVDGARADRRPGCGTAGTSRTRVAQGAAAGNPTSCAISWSGSARGTPPPGSLIASGTWQTYGPLPFLPPECQNAVVLQATLGHATGVGFGGSPAARHSRVPAEFEQHARDVAALWGRRLLQSRVIFLAGNDVLHRPLTKSRAFLSAIGRTFPIEPRSRAGPRRIEPTSRREATLRRRPRVPGRLRLAPARPRRLARARRAGIGPDQPRRRVGRPATFERSIARAGPTTTSARPSSTSKRPAWA